MAAARLPAVAPIEEQTEGELRETVRRGRAALLARLAPNKVRLYELGGNPLATPPTRGLIREAEDRDPAIVAAREARAQTPVPTPRDERALYAAEEADPAIVAARESGDAQALAAARQANPLVALLAIIVDPWVAVTAAYRAACAANAEREALIAESRALYAARSVTTARDDSIPEERDAHRASKELSRRARARAAERAGGGR